VNRLRFLALVLNICWLLFCICDLFYKKEVLLPFPIACTLTIVVHKILPLDHTKYPVGLKSNECICIKQSTDGAWDLARYVVLLVSSTCIYNQVNAITMQTVMVPTLHTHAHAHAHTHTHIHTHIHTTHAQYSNTNC